MQTTLNSAQIISEELLSCRCSDSSALMLDSSLNNNNSSLNNNSSSLDNNNSSLHNPSMRIDSSHSPLQSYETSFQHQQSTISTSSLSTGPRDVVSWVAVPAEMTVVIDNGQSTDTLSTMTSSQPTSSDAQISNDDTITTSIHPDCQSESNLSLDKKHGHSLLSINEFSRSRSTSIIPITSTTTSISQEKKDHQYCSTDLVQSQTSTQSNILTRAGESPYDFIARMKRTVARKEWGLLLSKKDPFYDEARSLFIKSFDFRGIPLDLCLRKFLYHVGLPPESQQINRLMDTFSDHYESQNPTVYQPGHKEHNASNDVSSLIFLHTFLYNTKSNVSPPTREQVAKMYNYPMMVFYENLLASEMILGKEESTNIVPLENTKINEKDLLYAPLPPPRKTPRSAVSVSFALGFTKSDIYQMVDMGEKVTIKEDLATPFACLGIFQGIPQLDFRPSPQQNYTISFMYKPETLQQRASTYINVLVVKKGRVVFRPDISSSTVKCGPGSNMSIASSPANTSFGKSSSPVEWYMALTASGQVYIWKSTVWLRKRQAPIPISTLRPTSPRSSLFNSGSASVYSERSSTKKNTLSHGTLFVDTSQRNLSQPHSVLVAPQPSYVFTLENIVALVDHSSTLVNSFRLILSSLFTSTMSTGGKARPHSTRPPILERKSSAFSFGNKSKHASGEYLLQCENEYDMWDWVYHINLAATLRTVGFKTIAKDPSLLTAYCDNTYLRLDDNDPFPIHHPHSRSSSAASRSSSSSNASTSSYLVHTFVSTSSSSSSLGADDSVKTIIKPNQTSSITSSSKGSTSSVVCPPPNRHRSSLLMSMLRFAPSSSIISEEPISSMAHTGNVNTLNTDINDSNEKLSVKSKLVAPSIRRLHSSGDTVPHLKVDVHSGRSSSIDSTYSAIHSHSNSDCNANNHSNYQPRIRSSLSVNCGLIIAGETLHVRERGRSRTRSQSMSLQGSNKVSQSVSTSSDSATLPFHITMMDTAGGLSGIDLMKEKLILFRTQLNNAMISYREQVHIHAQYSLLAPAYAKTRLKSIAIGKFITEQLWRLSIVIEKFSVYIYILEQEIGGDSVVQSLMTSSSPITSTTTTTTIASTTTIPTISPDFSTPLPLSLKHHTDYIDVPHESIKAIYIADERSPPRKALEAHKMTRDSEDVAQLVSL